MMNNQGMVILGTDETLENHTYSFGGLSDVYELFMMDISGAAEMPVTKLFGRSPAGMNATGESDLQNYYDSIEEKQESILRPALDKIMPVLIMSTLGMELTDFNIKFNPVRRPSDEEKKELSSKGTSSVIEAYSAGIIGRQTALKELRQLSEFTGMWTNISDEMIANADDEVQSGDIPAAFGFSNSMGESPNFNMPSEDTLITADGDWEESKHPRKENGQFGEGGSGENKSGNVKSNAAEKSVPVKVNPAGANKFKKGFEGKNLDDHWDGSDKAHSHKDEYPGYSKKQYAQEALDLIQMPVGGSIQGFATSSSIVVRYDKAKNNFVKGSPEDGIITMFKPKNKQQYFIEYQRKEKQNSIK